MSICTICHTNTIPGGRSRYCATCASDDQDKFDTRVMEKATAAPPLDLPDDNLDDLITAHTTAHGHAPTGDAELRAFARAAINADRTRG